MVTADNAGLQWIHLMLSYHSKEEEHNLLTIPLMHKK